MMSIFFLSHTMYNHANLCPWLKYEGSWCWHQQASPYSWFASHIIYPKLSKWSTRSSMWWIIIWMIWIINLASSLFLAEELFSMQLSYCYDGYLHWSHAYEFFNQFFPIKWSKMLSIDLSSSNNNSQDLLVSYHVVGTMQHALWMLLFNPQNYCYLFYFTNQVPEWGLHTCQAAV